MPAVMPLVSAFWTRFWNTVPVEALNRLMPSTVAPATMLFLTTTLAEGAAPFTWIALTVPPAKVKPSMVTLFACTWNVPLGSFELMTLSGPRAPRASTPVLAPSRFRLATFRIAEPT